MTESSTSHLRPDGTTFPPVTPDPPYPPGYQEPQLPDPSVHDVHEEGSEAEPPD